MPHLLLCHMLKSKKKKKKKEKKNAIRHSVALVGQSLNVCLKAVSYF